MWSLGGTQASYYCHRGKKKLLLSCSAVPPVSLLLSFSCCRPLLSLLPPSPLPGPRPPCLVQTHIHFSHCCNRRPFCFWCVNYPDTRPHGRVADMGVFSSLCVCVCVGSECTFNLWIQKWSWPKFCFQPGGLWLTVIVLGFWLIRSLLTCRPACSEVRFSGESPVWWDRWTSATFHYRSSSILSHSTPAAKINGV